MSSRSEKKQPRRPRRRWLKWTLGTVAGIIILAAVLVGLFRVAANILPGYHDEIEQRISQQIGAPVKLGKISLVWQGWGPALAFNKLKVINPKTGQAVLGAKRLMLDFSLSSLVHGSNARPYAISLKAPSITLKKMPDGSIVLPGLSFASKGSGNIKSMLDTKIEAHDGRIRLRFPDNKVWTFSRVKVLIGGGTTHDIRISAQMPAALGGKKLFIAGQAVTKAAHPGAWTWNFHYALKQVPLSGLQEILPMQWALPSAHMTLQGQIHGQGAVPGALQGALKLGGIGGGR